MPHIHTEPGQHDLTASAYIVHTGEAEPRLWLHLHKKLGKYLQFGGHVELSETPWHAVRHEITEESGYRMDQLKILQPLLRLRHLSVSDLHPYPISLQTHTFPGLDHFHTDISYGFTTTEMPTAKVQAGESVELKLFTLDELNAIPDEQVVENVRETARFLLTECLPAWEAVAVA